MDPFLQPFRANEEAAIAPQFFMHEGEECVKVLIAGNSRFAPVFRAQDEWSRGEFGEPVTYADRFADQYRQFKEGSAQTAGGTALEEAPFLNPSRIADLRALKVFSLEGLASFDDRYISRLGGNGYRLKELAQEFIAKRAMPPIALAEENADLRRRLEALEAQSVASDERSDDELKEAIFVKHGSRPRGQPSRATLLNMLAQEPAAQTDAA